MISKAMWYICCSRNTITYNYTTTELKGFICKPAYKQPCEEDRRQDCMDRCLGLLNIHGSMVVSDFSRG